MHPTPTDAPRSSDVVSRVDEAATLLLPHTSLPASRDFAGIALVWVTPSAQPHAASAIQPQAAHMAGPTAAGAGRRNDGRDGIACRGTRLLTLPEAPAKVSVPEVPLHLRAAANDDAKPAPRGGLSPSVLRRVCEHVDARLAGRIEIDELAEIAGLSTCHFSRAFKQSTGLPPHRYVMQHRIDVAASLLKETDLPIADLSLAVGFSDQSHFSRIFGQLMTETPRAYRKRHR